MLKNYFKIAFRNLFKNKVYSFINIFGLAVGIACCLLIAMYVQYEFSFDQYHENGNRIYRVIHASVYGEDLKNFSRPAPEDFNVLGNASVGPAIKKEFPEVLEVVQFSERVDILLKQGERTFQEEGVFYVDSAVFDLFSWEFIAGDPETSLAAPYSMVLTESTAKKYFGDKNPIGQRLEGSASAERADPGIYTITGVIKDLPENSHFTFSALLSMSTFSLPRRDVFDAWGYLEFYTYFLVTEQFDLQTFEKKIPEFLERVGGVREDSRYWISFEPLSDVYLKSYAGRQPGLTGSLPNIYIFSLIGSFILIIACINFMNLSTARSLERAKEIGVRKAIGANRKNLMLQFLGESLLIVVFAAFLAMIFVDITFPFMKELTGKHFASLGLFTWQSALLYLIGLLGLGLLSGIYPAVVLSGFKPVSVLKGHLSTHAQGGGMRKALVVFQFCLSIALIAGTCIVFLQLSHLLDKRLGFDQEQMLVIDYNHDSIVNGKLNVIKNEFSNLPEIISVAASGSIPGSYFSNEGTLITSPDGELVLNDPALYKVDMDFIPHFKLEMAAGRVYSRDFPADSARSLVINEAAAKLYGYADPEDIIGKRFEQWDREGEIIGVVKDFNYLSLHQNIEPLILRLEPHSSRYLTLKIKSDDLPGSLTRIDQIWQKLAPHRPFLYSFLDEDFDKQYQADFRFRKLFTTFSCLAILIACLGLLGLATYTAEQRTKEIGIRKVLGASVASIVGLLSKDFIKLVLIGFVIAVPIAWYAMNRWLADFAYRIEIGLGVFVIAGGAALLIALATVSWQSVKAALMNPVESLRNE